MTRPQWMPSGASDAHECARRTYESEGMRGCKPPPRPPWGGLPLPRWGGL
jgi:hypothetical protein